MGYRRSWEEFPWLIAVESDGTITGMMYNTVKGAKLELRQVLYAMAYIVVRGENWLASFEPCTHSIVYTSHHAGSVSAKTNHFRYQKRFVLHI